MVIPRWAPMATVRLRVGVGQLKTSTSSMDKWISCSTRRRVWLSLIAPSRRKISSCARWASRGTSNRWVTHRQFRSLGNQQTSRMSLTARKTLQERRSDNMIQWCQPGCSSQAQESLASPSMRNLTIRVTSTRSRARKSSPQASPRRSFSTLVRTTRLTWSC